MTANTQGAAQAAPATVAPLTGASAAHSAAAPPAPPTVGHNGGPPLAPAKLSRTFKLAVPISAGDGKTWDTIMLTEPELGHYIVVNRRKTASSIETMVHLFSLLSGVPEDALRRMKSRDARPVRDWVDAVRVSGALADVIRDASTPDGGLPAALAIADAADALGAFLPPDLAATAAAARTAIDAAKAAVAEAVTDEARAAAQAVLDAATDNPFKPDLESTRTFRLAVPLTMPGAAPVEMITLREPDLETGIAVEKADKAVASAAMLAVLSGHTIPTVSRLSQRDVVRMERWLDFFSDAGAA